MDMTDESEVTKDVLVNVCYEAVWEEYIYLNLLHVLDNNHENHTINRAAFVCLSVCSLSPPRSFDRSSPNLVGVCRWTSELPLRGSFSKRSTGRRVNGSLSLSTILYICQPHSTQLQKATLLLLDLIRLKGTFCSMGNIS